MHKNLDRTVSIENLAVQSDTDTYGDRPLYLKMEAGYWFDTGYCGCAIETDDTLKFPSQNLLVDRIMAAVSISVRQR